MSKKKTITDNEGFLTKSEIEEFKKIAFEDYGVKLTDEQALEQGIAIVSFFEYIFKERLKNNKQ